MKQGLYLRCLLIITSFSLGNKVSVIDSFLEEILIRSFNLLTSKFSFSKNESMVWGILGLSNSKLGLLKKISLYVSSILFNG